MMEYNLCFRYDWTQAPKRSTTNGRPANTLAAIFWVNLKPHTTYITDDVVDSSFILTHKSKEQWWQLEIQFFIKSHKLQFE